MSTSEMISSIRKIMAGVSAKTGRMLRVEWTVSGLPQGSYKWQRREYVRMYLVDAVTGKEVYLPNGTRTVRRSAEILVNFNGRRRVIDREYADNICAEYAEVCARLNHGDS